ncbi:phage portal protein [Bacillus chungangensis]|uniref:SPP1 family phage portal protein n=1 Tax=Bacillus chungangensis TaxID=587633 RepID=A0ABT9WRS4_9BACI|nr:phage portal protein [Bacillus chungangensis]MDQ0176001.1 SPP1 family phage portal protein [Bacillus chungangensis]
MQKIKLDKDTEISGELVKNIIQAWGKKHIDRYETLEGYYRGNHSILARTVGENKPNNKLVSNYAKYITDISTGYFMGRPVTYDSDKEEYLNQLFSVLDRNYEEDVNYELAKEMSICGVAYELLYVDEGANVRFKNIDHKTIIPVYSDDIEENLIFAIRHYTTHNLVDNTKVEKAEVYSADEIIEFTMTNDTFEEVQRQEHYFGDVPIIEYVNNEERIGDFEIVLSLIDAYNKSQSDTANDFEYFTDAYLVLIGMSGTEQQDIDDAKEKRVLLLDENGQAQWLIKEVNDSVTENYKNRLQKDIHRLSQIPNLTDEEFAGNLSGVALRYKLWGIEQVAAIKERKFKTGLTKRIQLITNFLNIKGASWEYDDIFISFHRNIPQNLLETVQIAKDLYGLLSEKTLLGLLPFIDDIEGEIDRKQEEEDGYRGAVDPYDLLVKQGKGGEYDDQ